MDKTFAFIGAGNMGGAIIKAVCRAVPPKNVAVFDGPCPEKVQALSAETGCRSASSTKDALGGAHFVFLCVKPNVLADTIRELAPLLTNEQLIVSIAAGVETAKLKAALAKEKKELPVVRLMPNTPVAVGKGMILMAATGDTREEELAILEQALSQAGLVARADEKDFDAGTAVFSCSPAFVYMFIEALADGGVMAGLPRDKAQTYAAQAVLGAATMVLESGLHPGQLKDEVCSPGGSTIVGVEALERNAFRGTVASAVCEAYEKTKSLGK